MVPPFSLKQKLNCLVVFAPMCSPGEEKRGFSKPPRSSFKSDNKSVCKQSACQRHFCCNLCVSLLVCTAHCAARRAQCNGNYDFQHCCHISLQNMPTATWKRLLFNPQKAKSYKTQNSKYTLFHLNFGVSTEEYLTGMCLSFISALLHATGCNEYKFNIFIFHDDSTLFGLH